MRIRRATHGLEWYVTHGWGQPAPPRAARPRHLTPAEGGVTPHGGAATTKRWERRVVVARPRGRPVLRTTQRQGRSGGSASRVRVVVARQLSLRAAPHTSAVHHHAAAHHHPAAPHHHRPRMRRP